MLVFWWSGAWPECVFAIMQKRSIATGRRAVVNGRFTALLQNCGFLQLCKTVEKGAGKDYGRGPVDKRAFPGSMVRRHVQKKGERHEEYGNNLCYAGGTGNHGSGCRSAFRRTGQGAVRKYPAWHKRKKLEAAAGYDEEQLGEIINQCITKPLKGKALDPAATDMKSLIMYLRTFARHESK